MNNNHLLAIAAKYNTPLYVYNFDRIAAQYNRLTQAFNPEQFKFFYACKALTNINVLKFLKKLGCGLDTVSIEEVRIGLLAGYLPHEIIYTPNCVSFDEILEAKELGVTINIDNISILEQFGNKFGNSYPVCVRINPHILAGGNYKISTGHIDSKFGISIHQWRHIQRLVKSTNLNIKGLHMHTGSDILDTDVFLRGVDILMDLAQEFNDLAFIDLGSGFKVPYKPDDTTTNIEELGQKLRNKLTAFNAERNGQTQIYFEPGKFLVSESGYFLVNVNVVKQTTATVFAGINSGFNHLIRPMFYDAFHHIENLSNLEGVERIYTVVGNICETDTFAWDRKIKEINEGDVLCFYNAGAYGFAMASNYNSRLRPAEVMVYQGKDHCIRQRETIDDILRNQIEIDF